MTKRRKADDAKRQLTPRQVVLAKRLLNGATITDSARDADPVCSGFARPQSGAEYFRIRCRPVQVSYEILLQSVASWREFSPEMLHLFLA